MCALLVRMLDLKIRDANTRSVMIAMWGRICSVMNAMGILYSSVADSGEIRRVEMNAVGAPSVWDMHTAPIVPNGSPKQPATMRVV